MPQSVAYIPATDRTPPPSRPRLREDTTASIVCLVIYLVVLVASINHDSLWADEAFSAWVVSHRSFGDMLHTLFTGDSSDLQMFFYLAYLHAVVDVLGWGEWAMRFANAPFAILFGIGLYWTSTRVFDKRFAWLAPGLMPFAWVYVREARPYCVVLGCATVSVGCLLGYLYPQGRLFNKRLPIICLGFLFLAIGSHMLALFGVPPMLLLAFLSTDAGQRSRFWREWAPAVRIFAFPYVALAAFFGFTFLRGTGYAQSYPRPSISRFFYTAYEFSGLTGLGPDHLEMWGKTLLQAFRPYFPTLLPGVAVLGASLALALVSYRSSGNRKMVSALGLASLLGVVEVFGLSVASHNQLSSRHWSAIIPIFLFLYLALLNSKRASTYSVFLLALVWGAANIRLETFPQYRKEDYRGTAADVISKGGQLHADIAWQPDPLAGRYYGIDFPSPLRDCFPMPQTCSAGFSHVPWPVKATGESIVDWKRDRIEAWMNEHARAHKPVIVVLRTSRDYETADWRTVIARQSHVTSEQRHGMEVLTISFEAPKDRGDLR